MSCESVLFNLLLYRRKATGLSHYTERLLAAWPQNFRPLQVCLTSDGTPILRRSLELPVEPRSFWIKQLQAQALVQHVLPLRKLLRHDWPELIYSPFPDWLWSFPDVRQVITCHDLIPLFYPNSLRAHMRSRFWLPRHLERASRIVAISQFVADQLIATGIGSRRIVVIKNGVSPIHNPIQSPVSRNCVVIARHAKHKNLSLVLNGFSSLLKRYPKWPGKLFIVGSEDRCTAALRRQQKDLGLQHHVIWINYLRESQLKICMRTSFCLISPSLMEGFDYPLMEAQAIGLPTLASQIRVHQELYADSSLLFDLDDQGDSMASHLLRLDRDPLLWRQISQAGLSNAADHTSQRQVQMLCELLSSDPS